jgi:multidrug efflux pump
VSREEVSPITVEFVLERATDAAANDVRDRVSRVRGQLPDEVDEPIIAKVEADAQAILWLRLNSDRHGALEISDYADRYVVDRLKTLSGVSSVIIGGERRYAMRLWLDRERLAGERRRTWRMRSAGRTSRCPRDASRAPSASSRCSRRPICARPRNSTGSSSAK